jgi:acetolactate synthase-1/3 small subunit
MADASGGRAFIIDLVVRDHPGAMSHIVGLFARRAYNLEGIVCGPLEDGTNSRILLRVRERARLTHLLAELSKLYDVIEVELRRGEDPEVLRSVDAIGRRFLRPGAA